MNTLCVDTSNQHVSFSLLSVDENEEFKNLSASYDVKGKVSEKFLELFDFFLDSNGLSAYDIDLFLVVVGPGSFTGVRIGLAFLDGLTLAINKELKGISSLDAFALASGESRINVAVKLRFNEYACKSFNFVNGVFSDISVKILDDTSDYKLINNISTINLTKAVFSPLVSDFYIEPTPVYIANSFIRG